MRKINFIILVILIAITCLLFNCKKIIEAKDLPQQDPRLVLNCIVYKDSLVKSNISLSKSILSGKDYKLINNAVCELYINDIYTETLVNFNNGNYKSSLKGIPNNKYTLKVIADGYKTVEGNSYLSDSVIRLRYERFDTVNATFRKTTYSGAGNPNIGGGVRYHVYLKDKLSEENFYKLQPIIALHDSLGNKIDYAIPCSISFVEESGFSNTARTIGGNLYTDDKTIINNNEIALNLEIHFDVSTPVTSIAQSVEIGFLVSSLSKDIYKYQLTLSQQFETNNGGALFAEPVLVYNNITNGMGIVGCISARKISIGRLMIKK